MFRSITSKDDLIDELAGSLDCLGLESDLFIDLTNQNIGVSFADSVADEFDAGREIAGHEIVYIAAISSREGFEIMRDFADGCGERQRERLICALSKRHPFRMFKDALMNQGLLDEWYAFKNNAYRDIARLRLDENDIDFSDGKIVCGNKDYITTYHYEGIEDEFDGDE